MKYNKFNLISGILCLTLFGISQPVQGQLTSTENTPEQSQTTTSLVKSDTKTDTITVPTDAKTPNLNTKKWRISFSKILFSLIIFLVVFIIIRYTTKFVEMLGERWGPFRLLVKRAVPILRITGWTIVIYFIIAVVLAPPIETLIAVTASAGIAIGFASQDILKNIFGGIMILFDRPFQVGDKISIGNHYGEVIQIGLRTVRIVTADDSVVSIPNGEIVNQSVSFF